MSIKTIAVNAEVYERLAREKTGSESFTKVIDRLITAHAKAGTCGEAVEMAARVWVGGDTAREADLMEAFLRETRAHTAWKSEPLE